MALTDSDLDFSVWAIMNVPCQVAYDAVAQPDQLQKHFTTAGAKGVMETGATVEWEFADFPGAFEVDVIEASAPNAIVFDWGHPSGEGANRVTFRFEPVEGDRCKVTVTETGWTANGDDLQAAFGNCMGWSYMLSAMKAWLEFDICLRDGMFR